MQVVKNTVSLLFSICLIVGLMPTLAFAEDEASNGSADSQCVCEVKCADGSVNTDCPVCGSDGADLTKCLGSSAKDKVQDVQNQIDALPSLEELQAMSQDEQKQIYTKLQAVNDAYNALSDDEKANITGSEALSNLFSFFNSGNVSALGTTTEVTYLDENGDTKTVNATVVDNNSTSWSEGWYVVDGDVTINDRVSTMGNVNLILKDGCKFTAKRGIGLQPDSNFSVYGQSEGTGELETNGGGGTAGIGSNYQSSCGNITINGGTVNAFGDGGDPGIGSGNKGSCGNITINGGTVNASAEAGGAGIGSGFKGSCGSITINGGTVNASAKAGGDGIGGGSDGDIANVTIQGGTVTALTEAGGDGIGQGESGFAGAFSTGNNGHAVIFASSISDQSNKDNWSGVIFIGNDGSIYGTTVAPTESFTIPEGKTLTIESGKTLQINEGITLTNNGTINNNGSIEYIGEINGNGSVSGNNPSQHVTYLDEKGVQQVAKDIKKIDDNTTNWSEGWYVVDGDVAINSRVSVTGNVNLILKDDCKLTVDGGIGLQPDSNISIYGQGEGTGELSIDGCDFGNAGIGSNNGGSCGDIAINGGCVDVRGSADAAGIGSGFSSSNCGQITINGGNVSATAGDGGSGIGSGYSGSSCLGISINGGSVFATGGTNASGVGGGYCSGCGSIDIKGGTVTATGGGYGSAGIGAGYADESSCGAITIEGGVVSATGGDSAPGIGSGKLNTENVKFYTGNNGHAVIFTSSISDQSNKDNWSGVIFIGNDGSVYGTIVAPTESFTIPEGKTLTIESDKTLQINEGVVVTNNGKINVNDGGTYNGSQPIPNPVSYQISFPFDQDAFTVEYVDGNNEGYVSQGSDLQFKININQYYYKTESFEVKANDQKLDANAEGVYTVQNITSPTSITIDGVEKDDAAPVLSGIENGKTYCEPVEATVDETNLAKVTINGVETTVNDGKFTVNPAAGEQTIAATDKAGNTTTCTITVNDGHTYVDGKCSVCGAVDPTYTVEVTAGANSTWKKGSKEGLSFTSNAAYSYFQKVQIDGNDVDQSNYTVQEGSTIVSLNAAYLETLPVGKHTIAIVSDTGTATTEFTIVAAQENEGPVTNNHPDNPNDQLGNTNNQPNNGSSDANPALPKTGDPVNMVLVIALALVAVAALAAAIVSVVVRIRRTKNKLH